MTRNEEIADFLKSKYNQIGDKLYAVEPRVKVPETDQRIIYENSNKSVQITYGFKGTFQGNVFIYINNKQNFIFSKVIDFAKYLEYCTRNDIKPIYITDFLIEIPKIEESADKPELPTEKSKLISFLNEEDKVFLNDNDIIKTPSLLRVDKEEWNLENFSYETVNDILKKLYNRHYCRIEVTYKEFYERKGRTIPLNTLSLVFLNEGGKVVMQYFDEKRLDAWLFFENRNGAGWVDGDLLPRINFHGWNIYEQNIVLDTGILGQKCREMFEYGCVDTDSHDRYETGFFDIEYFSNKNAYIKYRDEKGEFV